ncbi:hypothetical protein BDV38DRAFT_242625 [Aspergillus pseudotamarii]|uniref:Uncharacterized protein n=1 Tax=Aspergillus pseudotamarii TaxID=132259 RepID=A0A5N6SXK6_ASPPS|nr:uncharacterized protein BDV38DRAFT_242625 [Aspergillus pseudotamarii]KAE8139418.1 hypothetical protein BDV38DRAFT_242625 [Aspergillus pseudotamarii]
MIKRVTMSGPKYLYPLHALYYLYPQPDPLSDSTYRKQALFGAGIYNDMNVPEEVQHKMNIAVQTSVDTSTLESLASKL